MEIYKIENLSFTYPGQEKKALDNISLDIHQGEFITLCGLSGSGKTTLLRLLKSTTSPAGKREGKILFDGTETEKTDLRTQSSQIGFVMQNPNSQIVTDKVWHELSLGLENLGLDKNEIRQRTAEIASFFGIENLFHKKTSELSGGQKQLINLASAMVLQPRVLILDEPTGQLDPIADDSFLDAVCKINKELGTTVILSEHRLEKAFSLSHRIIVAENGKIIADGTPGDVCKFLEKTKNKMFNSLPVPSRLFAILDPEAEKVPLNVAEGKSRLLEYSRNHVLDETKIQKEKKDDEKEVILEAKNLYFRYEKNSPDTISDFCLKVYKGEFLAIIGGNGSGKTTALSLLSGLKKPQSGKVYINGKKTSDFGSSLYDEMLGVMPQNPADLFAHKRVFDELSDLTDKRKSEHEQSETLKRIIALCDLGSLLEHHPYDLSGGEQQRLALAMVLLKNPKILLLDEPTKGTDAHFKHKILKILKKLTESGITVIMVSHDLELCAEYAHRCAMVFDGKIISHGSPREVLGRNSFYTTSVRRMTTGLLENAVTIDDVTAAAGAETSQMSEIDENFQPPHEIIFPESLDKKKNTFPSPRRFIFGLLFALTAIASFILKNIFLDNVGIANYTADGIILIFIFFSIACFFPQREIYTRQINTQSKKHLSRRTVIAGVIILTVIPFTIYFGKHFLDDRKYYFISLLIILETLLPFFTAFESKKPSAKELVIISTLCGIAVAGRCAFFAIPEFKPVLAVVIISGICFGGEAGFLVGSMTAFASNFFFGQGPWTPWQMFAFGIIGYIAGIVFEKGIIAKTKTSLSVYGFLSALIIYGGIMNTATVLMRTSIPNAKMFLTAFALGLPMDFIHAVATAIFLWFISEPMLEKLERVKIKYGIID